MLMISKTCTTLLFFGITAVGWGQTSPAHIESFTPQGRVKQVRQVHVRFSEPLVPLGDPKAAVDPFEIRGLAKGSSRWADSRNWIYDFDEDLPAGIRMEFRLKEGLKTLGGAPITGQDWFSFNTGGPSILDSQPHEGPASIDEEQIFILRLDGTPTDSSVLDQVYFVVQGIAERVGIRLIQGEERTRILNSDRWITQVWKPPLLLIQPKRRFPNGATIRLVWGKAVTTDSGLTNEQDQVLPFVVRPAFTATLECLRVNPDAGCVPISPIHLVFSAPIDWHAVRKATIRNASGRQWLPKKAESEEEGDKQVQALNFEGPFPEKAELTMNLPPGLRDDAGRPLTNAARFPLTFHTDEYPPLVKFSADFGILELHADPALPVTLRNVEPEVSVRSLGVNEGEMSIEPKELISGVAIGDEQMEGRFLRIPPGRTNEIMLWLQKIKSRAWNDREKSIFGPGADKLTRSFKVPKLHGPKSFEVIGIPLSQPGFYVVEIASELLGAALLESKKTMYVPTTALVTNLSVHFKWGIESSLVWVTTLDTARPVAGARVEIRNCEGALLWRGETDNQGAARPQGLPLREECPRCSYRQLGEGLSITASLGEDYSFVHSSWSEGIEPWRFQLPTEYETDLTLVQTILDRPLFRAGETVHMKHILRRHVSAGLTYPANSERTSKLIVQHLGSDQKYEMVLKWRDDGSAESTWIIPREAKLGTYSLNVEIPGKSPQPRIKTSGSFRVEEFRVPLMRASILPPTGQQVAPSTISCGLQVAYLSGGGAGSLPVKFRHQMVPGSQPSFETLDDFVFANGRVVEGIARNEELPRTDEKLALKSTALTLDKYGAGKVEITGLPQVDRPLEVSTELEYPDPNGEIQTVSRRIALWPARWLVGMKLDSWTMARDSLKLQVAVTDLDGHPMAGVPLKVDLFQRKTYSHRKRLVGGFYAYDHYTETKKVGQFCEGKTNEKGILPCEAPSAVAGNVILQAVIKDPQGLESSCNLDAWVAGKEQWWFEATNDDRMDLLPERKRYEPGEVARFQVRMPFRQATALVSVEREGVSDIFIKELSGLEPVVELPVKENYSPNIFVSVLAVRGRVNDVQPTATIDLGRPAFKLGIAEIKVGWKAHQLKVKVSTSQSSFQVREKVPVQISVRTAEGKAPARGSEVAVAAVDEGLLELLPNDSWSLLDAMMGQRRYAVWTMAAETQVIGKRHFGLKALPTGGGGGKQLTRELFDTLLLWKGRVALDANGDARLEVPLNDSLTSFRIVAVATAGADRFGTGSTVIHTTQDLILFAGLPPLARQSDRLRAEFTMRNTTNRPMVVETQLRIDGVSEVFPTSKTDLPGGESRVVGWGIKVPSGVDALDYQLLAKTTEGIEDRLKIHQKIIPSVPVRTWQATLFQLATEQSLDVARPAEAIVGRGGIQVQLSPSLVSGLTGVTEYMRAYPYGCLEQEISRAVVLKDQRRQERIIERLPAYLDSDGLAKYFPTCLWGSEVLTAYLVSIADEAGWSIPGPLMDRMKSGLRGFAEGRIHRASSLPTVDLTIRKLMALEALSRKGVPITDILGSITIEPNLWPTSAVIDWRNILQRVEWSNREVRLKEADQIVHSRLNFQGTTLGFSTEKDDFWWWLMLSADANANRLILALLDSPGWREDLPRLMRGALGRQMHGHWSTTVANAWGVLAVEKFSHEFEKEPVAGMSNVSLLERSQKLDWSEDPQGKAMQFPWPDGTARLAINHAGTGRPWATVASLAAIPSTKPFSSGYQIRRTIVPLEQKENAKWTRGDLLRIRLELEAQSDMTWVVVQDPIPAGGTILGTGLARDSQLLTQGEKQEGWVWPVYEERSQEAFRAYYEYVPKGRWTVEYTLRLNNPGQFNLPPTRVEALYAPEMLGEWPNGQMTVADVER